MQQGFLADVLLLVELLPVGTAGEVGVQRTAGPVAAVQGAAVPQVAIEDDDGAGRRDELDFVGMSGGGIGERLAGGPAVPVGAGYHPSGAVVGGEVVEQPDRVADLVVLGRDRTAPVGVHRLAAVAGQRGPEVKRGELEVAKHVGDAGQHPGVGEAGLEHRALVDQIGEPIGPGLLVHLDPGLVPLGGQQFGQPGPDRRELGCGQDTWQRRVAVPVEPLPDIWPQAGVGGAKLTERGPHVHGRLPKSLTYAADIRRMVPG